MLAIDTTRAEQILSQLATRFESTKQTVATAESCTGGLLAALLTHRPGSSAHYLGGVAAYSNFAKEQLLGVPSDLINTHGAVSKEVAEAMAQGVAQALNANLAISVTGVAGPDGGSEGKPVGTVWCGFYAKGALSTRLFQLSGNREQIRGQVSILALEHLLTLC